MSETKWVEWSPQWAPHVKGRYTRRERGPYGYEPQQVKMVCMHKGADGVLCGETWQTSCSSGNVRTHISKFAVVHAHRDDPFVPPHEEKHGNDD